MSNIENTTVNHPAHYNMSESGIETIKIVRHFDFDCGNAFKYLMRFRYKNNPREDLEKAIWYLNDKITSTDNASSSVTKTFISIKEEIRNYISSVINAEKNVYVRNALILIAEYATFGVPIFVNPNIVVADLNEHIDEISSEKDENLINEELVNDTNKLLEKVDKSTEVEDLKQTWEKAKQTGLLSSSTFVLKNTIDAMKSSDK